jgi:NAD(P)-dependent dehydrogenase (short-subunit alcohol dehydrogenase family)
MTEAFIFDHVRTPRGKGRPNGTLREITPIQLIAGYATAMAKTPIMVKGIPQRRLGQPGDLDGALLLLASDASRYMTGSIITIDGGHLVNTL